MYQWLRLRSKQFDTVEEYNKQRASLRLELVADGADLLRVLPPTGYLPLLLKTRWAAQPAFSGWMGVVVGFIGTRKVWCKLKM